jgi:hypothetical protein
VIKFVLCLAVVLVLSLSSSAQQQLLEVASVAVLPDAPMSQGSAAVRVEVAGISSSMQSASEPVAQTTAASAQTPETQTQTPEDRHAQAEKELKEEESQRMLGVIPNFNTVMSGEAAPIDAKEKFRLFFKSSVDPFQFVAAGVDALIEQGEDSYPEYGQGIEGFSKRYGAAFADGFDGNFWGNAVLPSVLHQDPRYFRLGHGTFKRRLWYSVLSTVRCKGDNGKWEPNYSNVFGNFIGGAISNVYYPAADRGVGLTLERGLTVNAEGAIGSLAVEFYPDVIKWYRNRQARKAANP